jgi:hypothetical protein
VRRRLLAVTLLMALLGTTAGTTSAAPTAPEVGPLDAARAPLPAPPGRSLLMSHTRRAGFPDLASLDPASSADGMTVAFASFASDLVPGDEPRTEDVFVLDRRTDRVTRAPNPFPDVPGYASRPAISGDGWVVAYQWTVTAPVLSGGSIEFDDFEPTVVVPQGGSVVAAWDRHRGGGVQIVSRNEDKGVASGASEPTVSRTGRWVAYSSLYDWPTDKDGTFNDVFRFDRRTRDTVLVSVGRDADQIHGSASAPSISGDGNLVAFASDAGRSIVPVDAGPGSQIFLRNLAAKRTELVSVPPTGLVSTQAFQPAVSLDGVFVAYTAFGSVATNVAGLQPGGVFRRDRISEVTMPVSVRTDGGLTQAGAYSPSISANGGMVAFLSPGSDLVPEAAVRVTLAATSDGPSIAEAFLRDMDRGDTQLISVSKDGRPSSGRPTATAVGGDGRFTFWDSNSALVIDGDDNEAPDVFVRDLYPVTTLAPKQLDFGTQAVGASGPPQSVTLGNDGWSRLTVAGGRKSGPDAKDFRITDGCQARSLATSERCTVTVVFHPGGPGTRRATLEIVDDATGSPRRIPLVGRASLSRGTVVVTPKVARPGTVVVVTGSGFPANSTVDVHWSVGITRRMAPLRVVNGGFRVPMLVFHNDRLGLRSVVVRSAGGTAFAQQAVPVLVTPASVIPPTFLIAPRFVDIPLVLVIR